MLRILLLSLLFVGLYRFIVRFVLPIFKITSAVRSQMKSMQGNQGAQQQGPTVSRPKVNKADYIDYEEVR
jgi:hypothetical protein